MVISDTGVAGTVAQIFASNSISPELSSPTLLVTKSPSQYHDCPYNLIFFQLHGSGSSFPIRDSLREDLTLGNCPDPIYLQ